MPRRKTEIQRPPLDTVCQSLRELQRVRTAALKSRLMMENRVRAYVATNMGYKADLDEKARRKKHEEAQALINRVVTGLEESPMKSIILCSREGIDGFDDEVERNEKLIVAQVKLLPQYILDWVDAPKQRGVGRLSLGKIVGEAGNISNYSTVAKLQRRMGCIPWTFNGQTLMGSSWNFGVGKFDNGKDKPAKKALPKSEWSEYCYSGRRRSVMYVIGENLIKLNFLDGDSEERTSVVSAKTVKQGAGSSKNGKASDHATKTDGSCAGPYRSRYESSRAKMLADHPDRQPQWLHRHGMLMAVKLLLKNLWVCWNKKPLVCPTWGK